MDLLWILGLGLAVPIVVWITVSNNYAYSARICRYPYMDSSDQGLVWTVVL